MKQEITIRDWLPSKQDHTALPRWNEPTLTYKVKLEPTKPEGQAPESGER